MKLRKSIIYKGMICCATLSVGTATMADTIAETYGRPLRIPRAMRQMRRAPRQLTLFNNLCRSSLEVDKAQGGVSTGSEVIPFTGSGVVVGVVDCGIDPRHIAFQDPVTGKSRVALYITTTSSQENTKEEFRYKVFRPAEGEHIPKVNIDFEGGGHGTHTTGTAAGSKCGNEFYGMAPDATLVLTSMGDNLYEDEIMFGITSTLDYAREHEMPCVVSLSLGGTAGPHDGSGPISELLSQELEDDGQIICFAAGNNGFDKCSLAHDFDIDPEPMATVIHRGGYNTKAPGIGVCLAGDMKDMQIAFSLINFNADFDISGYKAAEEWRSDFVNVNELPFEAENILQNYAPIAEHLKADDSWLTIEPMECADDRVAALVSGRFTWTGEGNYTIGLVVKAPEDQRGKVVAYSEASYSAMGAFKIPGYSDGNPDQSISDHCTSPYVISIGATNARESYTDINGQTISIPSNYGDVPGTALYTSYGTIPEKLPHTMAPGTDVISSLINNKTSHSVVSELTDAEGNKWYYGADSGTSMSTPAIAGMIALWLQADPTLSRADILDLLERFGNTEIGGDRSQFGTPSAYEGLKYILSQNSMQIVPGTIGRENSNVPYQLMVKYLVDGQIEAVVPFATTGGDFNLYSIDGSLVKSGYVYGNALRLDLGDIKGVYLLQVITPQGIATQKIRI